MKHQLEFIEMIIDLFKDSLKPYTYEIVQNCIKELDYMLTPPTEEEVCEALNKLWKLDNKPHTTLHFVYDKIKKEFKMVNKDETEYRYISVNRWSDNSIQFVDLDLETLSLLGRFYEGVVK